MVLYMMLNSKKKKKVEERGPKRITLRLPVSLHSSLKAEAAAEGVSLNQLCVVKLAIPLRRLRRRGTPLAEADRENVYQT